MKICELTGYKKHPFFELIKNSSTVYEFIENLKREGYRKYIAGEGFYAGVFANPDDPQVTKIFEKSDTGYEKYLDYMMKNQNNPHVPKIAGKPFTYLKKYRVVRMEKLRPYDKNSESDQKTYSALMSYISFTKQKVDYIPSNIKWLEKKYPQLDNLIDLLVENYANLDLHSKNIMFRGDVPVITDPFS